MAKSKNDKKTHVNNSNLVKESNAIARAQLTPPPESVWEERIIAQIVAFNRVDDTEFPEADFMLGRLVDGRKKISGYIFQQIGKAVRHLARTTYTIYHNREKFDVFPIFARISYDNGFISARLNSELKPYFLQLKREFTMYSLPEFRSLSSIYSQQMYRFLASLRALKDTTVPLEQLHFVTTSPETFTSNFKDFRRRVLEPAEKEINAKTNLKFHWEPIRQGRKVTEIRFVFADEAIETTLIEQQQQIEKDEHAKWQRLANACWEKHQKAGTTCKPNNGNKCTFCQTRGRMALKDWAKTNNY